MRVVAESNLSLGHSVIVDAVNDSEEARETWRSAARRTRIQLAWVVLTCENDDEHRRRFEGRHRGFEHMSEPTWADAEQRAAEYPAWHDDHLAVDTSGALPDEIARRIVEHVSRTIGDVVEFRLNV